MKARPELLELLKESQRAISVEEYHRMIDADVFDEDDHVELLHGILVARSPQGQPHAGVMQRLIGLLVRGVGEAYDVRCQLPLTLSEDSEPEPDFAIVPHGHIGPGTDHPHHAFLVIEISRTSLPFDRNVKAPIYARAGIPEVWIVDVNGRRVEVLREPDEAAGVYRQIVTVGPDDALAPLALPGPKPMGRDLLA